MLPYTKPLRLFGNDYKEVFKLSLDTNELSVVVHNGAISSPSIAKMISGNCPSHRNVGVHPYNPRGY